MQTVSIHSHSGNQDDQEYNAYIDRIQARVLGVLASDEPVFSINANGLWYVYLDNLPPEQRQYHNCHTCQTFIDHYGGLVTIDERGHTHSLIWDAREAPPLYVKAVEQLQYRVESAKVTAVWFSDRQQLGTRVTGPWTHFALYLPAMRVWKHALLNANQKLAEKVQEHDTLVRALAEFKHDTLDEAVRILESDQLYRGEKVLGAAKWLAEVKRATSCKFQPMKDHIIWRYVATAPAGFCHPRASMIGTLLEDIEAGMDFESVSRRFAEKMHPLQYQRPQAAPKAGNIAQAEKVVAALESAGALRRRFARLDEIEKLWVPKPAKAQQERTGVFADVQARQSHTDTTVMRLTLPTITMTWSKFQREVLPNAEQMEFLTPISGNYGAFVTAADPDAPPILQWDREDQRNPFSNYVWAWGSQATQWRLPSNSYVAVDALSLAPAYWHDQTATNHKCWIMFVLHGAQETRKPSACLFPEILRSEYHAIRATIEAYSKQNTIEGFGEPHACGYIYAGDSLVTMRVHARGATQDYKLDRWD